MRRVEPFSNSGYKSRIAVIPRNALSRRDHFGLDSDVWLLAVSCGRSEVQAERKIVSS